MRCASKVIGWIDLLSQALAVMSIVAIAIGFWDWWHARSTRTLATQITKANAQTKTFGHTPVGSLFEMKHFLENETGRTFRVLGQGYACYRRACLSAEGIPLEVPPHSRREIRIKIKTLSAGDFTGQVVLLTDLPGAAPICLTIEGVIDEAFSDSLTAESREGATPAPLPKGRLP